MHNLTIEAVLRERANGDILSVPASAMVSEAVGLMYAHEIGAVMVMTEDGLFGGIFSERDLLVRVVHAGRDPAATPVSLVMTRDVRFVSPGTTIEAALSLMYVKQFRHLLVIEGPKVYGLVSMRDLVYQLIRRGEGRFEAAVRDASGPLAPLDAAGA